VTTRPTVLEDLARRVAGADRFSVGGAVAGVMGHEVEIRGLRLRLGDVLSLHAEGGERLAEVVAVGPDSASALVYGETNGIGRGDRVTRRSEGFGAVVSESFVGRVVDAFGNPMDGGPPLAGEPVQVHVDVPDPMERQRITQPLPVGVRVVDSLCTIGRGQRLGLFGGSGVGKSTLLGMMARGTTADVSVLALIGERGREVREFIEDDLGPEGMRRAVVVVATSDQPPLVRLRAGFYATRLAEWFADRGADSLLMFDSLTRMAMAQRDVGLAAGEPPTARGYTPSVFTLLPKLLERTGPRRHGTVTGLYTVLVDGDDMNDPIADAARSILDGHIVLDRRLGTLGRYPAIDPLASLSRLAVKVTTTEQRQAAQAIRAALAAAEEVRDLVEVGAYVPGTNPMADKGLAVSPDIVHGFLKQDALQVSSFDDTWAHAQQLAARAS
jgi:flagellum-specific ATP synthase